jgi:hypothetical protein
VRKVGSMEEVGAAYASSVGNESPALAGVTTA